MAIINVILSASSASALNLSSVKYNDISTPNLKPTAEQNAPPPCRYPPCKKKK